MDVGQVTRATWSDLSISPNGRSLLSRSSLKRKTRAAGQACGGGRQTRELRPQARGNHTDQGGTREGGRDFATPVRAAICATGPGWADGRLRLDPGAAFCGGIRNAQSMADVSRRNCGFGWCGHLHGVCRGSVRRRLSYGKERARAARRSLWSNNDRRRRWPYAALSHPRFFRRDRHLHMRGRGGARHHLLYPQSIHGYSFPRSGGSSRGRGVLVFIAGIAIGSS
jgi:hypothetical protein